MNLHEVTTSKYEKLIRWLNQNNDGNTYYETPKGNLMSKQNRYGYKLRVDKYTINYWTNRMQEQIREGRWPR